MPALTLSLSLRGNLLSSSAFDPASLFASSEPGILIDPSDLSTLFTDTAGTTPVTAPGQTVALALEKSRGLVLGNELVTNGTFDTDLSGWTLGADTAQVIATWNNGSVTLTRGAGGSIGFSQAIAMVSGRYYRVRMTVSAGTAALGGGFSATGGLTGVVDRVFLATNTSGIAIWPNSPSTSCTLDNISVRELPGNHLTQPVAAARPIYGRHPASGIRNLLTRTEEFNDAAWGSQISGTGVAPIRTPNAAIAPNGEMTADLITINRGAGNTVSDISGIGQTFSTSAGTCTGGVWVKAATAGDVGKQIAMRHRSTGYFIVTLTASWVRVSFSQTGSAVVFDIVSRGTFTADNTVSIHLWGASLQNGAVEGAYQRVGAPSGLAFPQPQSYDITEAGVPSLHYLFCDGLARWMVSPTITPGTDKAQIFAGVRKLSDAAAGAVVELSATTGANPGAFGLFAPITVAANYGLAGRGGNAPASVVSASSFPAPRSSVLSGFVDILADNRLLRESGADIASSAQDMGLGNFLAYPLYVGSRGGASLFFNGLIYSIVVRFGPNLPLATIQQVERWTAQRSGVTLP